MPPMYKKDLKTGKQGSDYFPAISDRIMSVHDSLNKRNIRVEVMKFLTEARSMFDSQMTNIHFTILFVLVK